MPILVLTGILFTNLNFCQQIFFSWVRVIGWTISGFITKDKAILTNFGLNTFFHNWDLVNSIFN